MRCTSKKKKFLYGMMLCLLVTSFCTGCRGEKIASAPAFEYEQKACAQELIRGDAFSKSLCVASKDVKLSAFPGDSSLHAAGLFDIQNHTVVYADRIHNKLFPASTTKILTTYIALKEGNMEDVITVSENATNFAPDESVCGLKAGDQLTLYDLLCGLMLSSGNDAGVAIAEHLAGSVEAFAEKMNEEARMLGATQSHFVNPHGLHDENHYTTAYDLYLIFQEAAKDSRFLDIIKMKSHTATITGADGVVRNPEWFVTNFYSAGLVPEPEGIKVLGGKTGTTDEAGSCVILYNENVSSNPYISVIMGAKDKPLLYADMTQLLLAGMQ